MPLPAAGRFGCRRGAYRPNVHAFRVKVSLLAVVYETIMIKGIIFDLGRTLIYSGEKRRVVDQEATVAVFTFLNANGFKLDKEFVTRFRTARERGLRIADNTHFEQAMEIALCAALQLTSVNDCVSEEILQRAVDVYFGVYEQYWRTYSDTIEALDRLGVLGLCLGAITNFENDRMMRRVLDHLGILPYLSPIITSAMVKWRKPRPQIFQMVSLEWGLSPHEIVMIGDSLRDDIAGAKSAGMRSILICRSKQTGRRIPDKFLSDQNKIIPDATICSLEEVQAAIARMN